MWMFREKTETERQGRGRKKERREGEGKFWYCLLGFVFIIVQKNKEYTIISKRLEHILNKIKLTYNNTIPK